MREPYLSFESGTSNAKQQASAQCLVAVEMVVREHYTVSSRSMSDSLKRMLQ